MNNYFCKKSPMKLITILSVVLLLAACSRDTDRELKQPKAEMINKEQPAKITFEETKYMFGKVASGEEMVHAFKFTNDGESPLIITDVQTSCGCTVPEWPKEPIAPGDGGEILVKFSSTFVGPTRKAITIAANTYPETLTKIHIEGEVVE